MGGMGNKGYFFRDAEGQKEEPTGKTPCRLSMSSVPLNQG
ncbi:hypothetical protein Pan216_54450 [Planctomycetes bacterium Pan216]|uniref:Uncharacterized protein n=1 Tax=Kolteria novifilia TaxID=2527975 RepID=A0A518BC42_9BACT|nr:hypothetical protein Pan216_54450 [Planctomycetes bacterium Pan216]